MLKKIFSDIPSILKDAKKGRMFILVDDENRENEGILLFQVQNVIQNYKFYG